MAVETCRLITETVASRGSRLPQVPSWAATLSDRFFALLNNGDPS
jgi:hypothetical protein